MAFVGPYPYTEMTLLLHPSHLKRCIRSLHTGSGKETAWDDYPVSLIFLLIWIIGVFYPLQADAPFQMRHLPVGMSLDSEVWRGIVPRKISTARFCKRGARERGGRRRRDADVRWAKTETFCVSSVAPPPLPSRMYIELYDEKELYTQKLKGVCPSFSPLQVTRICDNFWILPVFCV